MSLKGFHILLISLSSLVLALYGGWSLRAYRTEGGTLDLSIAIFCFAAATGLITYVIWFARRFRTRDEEDRERRKNIRPLAVALGTWMLSSAPSPACTVCYGEAEGPMFDAARLGVFLLFGVVLAMQIGFGAFFFYLRARAKSSERDQSGPGLEP